MIQITDEIAVSVSKVEETLIKVLTSILLQHFSNQVGGSRLHGV